MAHLHHSSWWTLRVGCRASKGGAAKLKAYVAWRSGRALEKRMELLAL